MSNTERVPTTYTVPGATVVIIFDNESEWWLERKGRDHWVVLESRPYHRLIPTGLLHIPETIREGDIVEMADTNPPAGGDAGKGKAYSTQDWPDPDPGNNSMGRINLGRVLLL